MSDLTKREYFAGQALAGLLANADVLIGMQNALGAFEVIPAVCKKTYIIADLMVDPGGSLLNEVVVTFEAVLNRLNMNDPEDTGNDDDESVGWNGDGSKMSMTFGHLRRARAAIAKAKGATS